MKISVSKPRASQASILVVALAIGVMVAIVLVSYLSLVHHRNASVARSQTWNSAIAIAEAGVEEALAHLDLGMTLVAPDPAADGWNLTSGYYHVPTNRNFIGGYYHVVIGGTYPDYNVYSTGYVRAPISGQIISRTVWVRTGSSSPFQVGIAAKTTIVLNGNNITIDSFDSADLVHFPNGRYSNYANTAMAYLNEHGDVATQSTGSSDFDVGVADIKGKIRTGSGGVPKILKNGSVGDAVWVDTGKSGIKPGWWVDDMNQQFPDVEVPFTGGAIVPSTNNGPTVTYLIQTSGFYEISSLNLQGSDRIVVSPGVDAALYVPGNISMQGQSTIDIGQYATFRIFNGVENPSSSTSATFTQVNSSPNASAITFQYYGLPSAKNLTWQGNAQYIGTVYAPSATFTLGGGGNDWMDYQGACVVNSINMNGKFRFHFDVNLTEKSGLTNLLVNLWREI